MSEVVYRIVEHDGGWAYALGAVISETFTSHDAAFQAARRAAAEQSAPGETAAIAFQDADGIWRTEVARGDDRPAARVED